MSQINPFTLKLLFDSNTDEGRNPREYKDLSLDDKHPCEKLGVVACLGNPSASEEKKG